MTQCRGRSARFQNARNLAKNPPGRVLFEVADMLKIALNDINM
jgi:hypothetical protein